MHVLEHIHYKSGCKLYLHVLISKMMAWWFKAVSSKFTSIIAKPFLEQDTEASPAQLHLNKNLSSIPV